MTLDPGSLGDLFRFVEGRAVLGRLAVLNGLATETQIDACIAEQRATADARPLGAILLARGLVTPDQLSDLLRQDAQLRTLDAVGGAPAEAGTGRLVGRYLLSERLGTGHAGVVWKAWDTQLQRWVALKEAREDSDFPRERFLREARAAARLRHPNLIEALEIGRHEGRDFLVMNYVEGKALDEVRLDPRRAAQILAGVADAVQAMHDAGILHRDIKPANILLDGAGLPHLGDFGIARDLHGPRMTVEGTLMGTPAYMSPEQASGQHDRVKPPADVYGLGATLYQLLTGRPPFQAEDDLQALLERLAKEAPAPPRQLNAQIPADLEAIALKALEKHPSDRYESAAAMAEDLRRFLRGEPIKSRPACPLTRAAKWIRRNPRIAVGTLAVAAIAAFLLARSGREQEYLRAYQEGVELWSRPSPQEALAKFEVAAAAAPGRPEPWLWKGRCLLLLKRPAEAEEALAQALRADPSFGPALLERGKQIVGAYVRRRLRPPMRASGGRVRFGAPAPEGAEDKALREKGEEYLAKAQGAKGLAPEEVRFIEGALAFGNGRYAEAATALREYVSKNRWDAWGAGLLGAACHLAGDFAAAEEALSLAIGLQPLPDRYRARGDARYALGRYSGAVEDYARAGEDAETYCNRGLALQAQGRNVEAIAEYTRALELRPKFARALVNRGTACAEQLELQAAERDFELALEQDEFHPDAYLGLGNVLLLKSNLAGAIQQYDIAVKIDPRFSEAFVQRARARRRSRDLEAAIPDYEAALRIDPLNADVLLELATAQDARGGRPGALGTLRRALEAGGPEWPLRDRASKLLSEWTK